jgi:DNA-directed RNA polymerase alpha subunit
MTNKEDLERKAKWPEGMSMPSINALEHAGIQSLDEVAGRSEKELASLHGMGPKGIRILKAALAEAKLKPLT